MTKKFGYALLTALLISLMPTSALLACTVTCGGTTCTGTAICSCDENGAHCEDYTLTIESLQAKADYARSFNTPGLNSFADSIEKMANAVTEGDQDGYFVSLLQRETALKSLSAKERRILNSWHGNDSKSTGSPQK